MRSSTFYFQQNEGDEVDLISIVGFPICMIDVANRGQVEKSDRKVMFECYAKKIICRLLS